MAEKKNTETAEETLYSASELARAVGVSYTAITRDAVKTKLAEAGFDTSVKGSEWKIPLNEITLPLLPKPKSRGGASRASAGEGEADLLSVQAELEKVEKRIAKKQEELSELRDSQKHLQREVRRLRNSAQKEAEAEVEALERQLAEARARREQVESLVSE